MPNVALRLGPALIGVLVLAVGAGGGGAAALGATIAPPVPTIDSGPPANDPSTSATFTFSDTAENVTFECSLDEETFASCVSPVTRGSLADGEHTFQVRAKDAVGDVSAAASRTWLVDTVAPPSPAITGSVPDNGYANVASIVFQFAQAGVTFECSLDEAAFAPCTSQVSHAGLAEGHHTFRLRAVDAALNKSEPTSHGWTVDRIAPPKPAVASVHVSPTGYSTTTTPTFTFTDTEEGVAFECRLDAGGFAACASPLQLTLPPPDGEHTFEVRARDAAGNTASESVGWRVDTLAPPTPSIASGPSGTVGSPTAVFTFTATEEGVSFVCSLDAAPDFTACPASFPGLAHGSHTVQARSKDAAGNVSPGTVSRTWSVDIEGPQLSTISSGPPNLSSLASATFTFSNAESPVTFECSLDDAAFTTCASPRSFDGLADGAHLFRVRAKDVFGNPSAPTARLWTVDTQLPPVPAIEGGPAGPVRSTSATFAFTSTESGTTFECRRDGAPFAPCPATQGFTGLTQGAHTLEVVAKDQAGNLSAPATRSWTVDTVRPNTTIVAAPARSTTARTATFRFRSSQSGSRFQCKLDRGRWTSCKTPKTYRKLKPGTHTFLVRAIDPAGNVDGTAAKRTWTIRG